MSGPFDLPTSVDLAAEPFDPRGQRSVSMPELLDRIRFNDDLADAAVDGWHKRTKGHDPQFADIVDAVEVDSNESERTGLALWMPIVFKGEPAVWVLAPTPRDELKRDAWQWDPKASRYRYKPGADRKLGKLVPEERVRRVARRAQTAEGKELQRLAERFVARDLTLAEFETALANRSAMMHLQMRMLGAGGRAQMSASHYQAARVLWGRDMTYLSRFGDQIGRGEVSAARIVERARLYAESSTMVNAYEDGRLFADLLAGKEWEEWELGPSDHCQGCLEQNAKGRVPIGELPDIGTQNCNGACRCNKKRGGG